VSDYDDDDLDDLDEDELDELDELEASGGGGRGGYRGAGLKSLWRDISGERIFGKGGFPATPDPTWGPPLDPGF
jgi:hypothetical protein